MFVIRRGFALFYFVVFVVVVVVVFFCVACLCCSFYWICFSLLLADCLLGFVCICNSVAMVLCI